eukprot:6581636-Pyramimonas_sp.AAC.1
MPSLGAQPCRRCSEGRRGRRGTSSTDPVGSRSLRPLRSPRPLRQGPQAPPHSSGSCVSSWKISCSPSDNWLRLFPNAACFLKDVVLLGSA